MVDTFKDEIRKLIRKAENSRHAHFLLAHRLNGMSKILHSFLLCGGAALATLTFAKYETFKPLNNQLTDDVYTLIVGGLATLIFVMTVLEEYVKWDERGKEHDNIGKQLTSFIRDSDGLLKQATVSENDVTLLRSKYNFINEIAPSIPDKVFLKAKQSLKIKIDISKRLDEHPFTKIKRYKRKKRKEDNSN